MKNIVSTARGFTLMEVLVVVGIISVLSSVVLFSVNEARSGARDKVRISDLSQIQLALKLYQTENGKYPDCTQGFVFDTKNAIDTNCDDLSELQTLMSTYMGSDIKDPKSDSSYQYIYDSNHKCGEMSPNPPVLIVKTMENGGNMAKGPCDVDNNGEDLNGEYGIQGRGSNNLDAYYIILSN